MLEHFIAANRDEIILRCRAKVALRHLPAPTEAEILYGVPLFLDQLVDALRPGMGSNPEIGKSAVHHGHELLLRGFTVSQVVHDYGDVCQSITQLAVEKDSPIGTGDFRTLNQCLDDAIASAVTEYGRTDPDTIDEEGVGAEQSFGFLAHEIRNLLNTATLAFAALDTGNVGVRGSTGHVLRRSLAALGTIMNRSIAEVRLQHLAQSLVPILVADFVDELAAAAALEAETRKLQLIVEHGRSEVTVLGDRQILAAIVQNLLQNAFKFTRPGTIVSLRASATSERVRIEVADECGGLDVEAESLFRPFERRTHARAGLGLGLAFSRRGAEANGGQIVVRNLPDHGCIFALEVPRVPAPLFAGSIGEPVRLA